MQPSRRTIGKLAKEAGVSVETIRYYERCGLIKRPERVGNRYRHYSEDILAQVRYIKIAKSLGFSLADIEKLRGEIIVRSQFCGTVKTTVAQKLEGIDQEIAELLALKKSLKDFQTRCARREQEDCPLFSEMVNLGLAVGSASTAVQ